MDPSTSTNPAADDAGAGENDAYIASLLDELNEARKKLQEKDSLLNETQERLFTLEETVKQFTTTNEDEKADDRSDQKIDHMHGLDRELAQSMGIDSVATYGHYVNAQRNLRFRRRSSAVTSALSTTFRNEGEIGVIQHIAGRKHSAEWDEICEDLDVNDVNGHAMTPLYSPPVQRQRYGDDKVLPHVGWGDLFFDLFFVGAAYNLGVLLKTIIGADQRVRGCMYFFGSLGPLWACWDNETFYQSRYLTIDYCHRITEVLRYIFVAFAIFNITEFQNYYDPLNANILIYTLSMTLEQMMQLALRVELYFKGLGDEVPIKNHSLHEIKFRKLPFLAMYIAALVVAAISYSRANDISDRGEVWDFNDLPMTITAVIYLLELLYEFSWYFGHNFGFGKNKDVRTYFVPVTVDYLIKRYGEFTLLLLGECILSLLGTGETTTSKYYYMIVIFGIVTVIWLLFLMFESEPSDAQAHALWGNRWNTVCYILLIQIITISLIGLGSSFKIFLHELIYENTVPHHDGGDIGTKFFVIVLSLVVISLELLNLCHIGIKRAVGHLFQTTEGGKRKLYWPVFVVALIKVGIFLFCFTLNQWIHEAEYIVPAGCAVVVALSITRVVVYFSLHQQALLKRTMNIVRQSVESATAAVRAATQRQESSCNSV